MANITAPESLRDWYQRQTAIELDRRILRWVEIERECNPNMTAEEFKQHLEKPEVIGRIGYVN